MMFSHCTILKFLPIIHFNIFFLFCVSFKSRYYRLRKVYSDLEASNSVMTSVIANDTFLEHLM